MSLIKYIECTVAKLDPKIRCRSIDETVQSFVSDTASLVFFGDGGAAEADRLNREAEEAKKERR